MAKALCAQRVYCPKCGTLETVMCQGHKVVTSKKFSSGDHGNIFHRPCRCACHLVTGI